MKRWTVDLCRPTRSAISVTPSSGSSVLKTFRIATARSIAWIRYRGLTARTVSSNASVVAVAGLLSHMVKPGFVTDATNDWYHQDSSCSKA